MIARVKIHESSLQKVRVGLPAIVSVDALPGRRFTGRVNNIALLPDPTSAWINPDLKVYRAEIHIDGDGSDLRTGMTCQVEIIVEQHDNAIYVPLQSVVRVGGQPVVFVAKNSGNGSSAASQARPVEIGLDNNRMINILAGLSEGEQVLLAPPLAASEAPLAGSNASSAAPLAETATSPETTTSPETPLVMTETPRRAAPEDIEASSETSLEAAGASSEVPSGKTEPSAGPPATLSSSIEIRPLQLEKSRTSFNESEPSD